MSQPMAIPARFRDIELRRVLSVQAALTYNKFIERVVRSDGRVADIVEETGASNQSAVMKQLSSLNRRFQEATGSNLFWKSADSGGWFSTPLGDELYLVTESIERRFNSISKWIDQSHEQANLRVVLNSYSFRSFIRIEEEMLRIDPNLKFKKDFVYARSHDIWRNVAHALNIDVGITESFDGTRADPAIETICLSRSKAMLVSNFRIPDSKLEDRKVSVSLLQSLPLLLGRNRTICEYLSMIGTGCLSPDTIRRMSQEDLDSFVTERYRLEEFSQSIQTLTDMLLIGKTGTVMVATPELKSHIAALNDAFDPGGKKRDIHFHEIADGSAALHKFALRRAGHQERTPNPIAQIFWQAALQNGTVPPDS